jgi:glycosyltransferase involved in cell wall biosynthesis
VADDGQPRFNVVKTYAFDDWGIYGRGDELLCRALARHQAVGRVFHVQPPADPASFRLRFQAPVWDADVEGQIRRFKGVEDDGVHLYTPMESPGRPDGALDRTVEMLEREQAFSLPLVLLQSLAHPFGADLARRLGGRGVTRVALARRDLRLALEPGSREHTLVSELYDTQVPDADLVWAATKELRDELRQRNQRTVLYPVGADPRLAGGTPAIDLADLPRPLVIYAGSMRASLDVALIRGTAERLGDHSFVFVGPHGDYLAPLLAGIKNIHVIGPRPYGLLPDYLAAADVAIAPHQVVPATQAVVPEKLYGYLAAGLPVVTTAVAGVEELRRLLWTARDPGEFARAIQGAHKRDRNRRRGLRQAAIAPLTWDAIAAHLVASVDAARRGAEPPAPPEPKVTVFPGLLAR